ncbi:MAG: hypothetical protein JST01_24750 [Cyanobacteria bacterium SZAS TMP-1]|nr:hypothetical protein [Cyanobacteria bacterium SZAS TMP-1]
MSFISALLMPVVMLVVLTAILGGNTASLGEALADTLGTALTMLFELFIRFMGFFAIGLIAVFSAAVRMLVAYLAYRQANKPVDGGEGSAADKKGKRRYRFKVGPDP